MYLVNGMQLIPQAMKMSCWYASAQMLIQWRRNKTQMSESAIVDPSQDSISEALKAKDDGLSNSEILGFAKRLGLQAVPPMSPTEDAIESWLKTYGPLWVNGKKHITVIAGIMASQVYVYDPAPKNVGCIEWRGLEQWYVGNKHSGRDTGNDVDAVFLHCPK